MVNNWCNIVQDYLFPPTCLLCGEPGHNSLDLCPSCYNALPENDHCCPQCAEPLVKTVPSSSLCGRCQSQQLFFDQTFAPFIYTGGVRYLIQALKYRSHLEKARLLGTLLANKLPKQINLPELILPVPLHKDRYRERGFNQSIEIARSLADQLQIPIDLTSCLRKRNTAHQTDLSARQRRNNLSNAFAIKHPLSVDHVAIVDDVMTTGTTVNELAKTLKNSGLTRVDVWVCAKT